MKIVRTCLAFGFIVMFASVAHAELDAKTSEMMEKLSQKAGEIESYTVDMKIETQMMGQDTSIDGSMAFKKPDKLHVVSTSRMMGGMTQETYSAGNIVWTYLPAMKMATKIDMSRIKEQAPALGGMQRTGNVAKPFEGLPKDGIRYVEKKTVDGVDVHVFESVVPTAPPSSPDQQMPSLFPSKMVLWLNAETGLPYKIKMLGKDDAVMMVQTYSNYRINIPIEDSEFEFTPPEGVQVMDMTEGTMNMMRQMQGTPESSGSQGEESDTQQDSGE